MWIIPQSKTPHQWPELSVLWIPLSHVTKAQRGQPYQPVWRSDCPTGCLVTIGTYFILLLFGGEADVGSLGLGSSTCGSQSTWEFCLIHTNLSFSWPQVHWMMVMAVSFGDFLELSQYSAKHHAVEPISWDFPPDYWEEHLYTQILPTDKVIKLFWQKK